MQARQLEKNQNDHQGKKNVDRAGRSGKDNPNDHEAGNRPKTGGEKNKPINNYISRYLMGSARPPGNR